MKKTFFESGRRGVFVAIPFIMLFILLGQTGLAEMKITTHDGRTHKVPVQAKEIKLIEFTDADSAGIQYLGCFRDQGNATGTSGRDLSGFAVSEPQMTTERCVSLCGEKGFRYAGTQYSSWCFCGNRYGKSGKADNCNMKCSGNNRQICGGSWANSVYSTE